MKALARRQSDAISEQSIRRFATLLNPGGVERALQGGGSGESMSQAGADHRPQGFVSGSVGDIPEAIGRRIDGLNLDPQDVSGNAPPAPKRRRLAIPPERQLATCHTARSCQNPVQWRITMSALAQTHDRRYTI